MRLLIHSRIYVAPLQRIKSEVLSINKNIFSGAKCRRKEVHLKREVIPYHWTHHRKSAALYYSGRRTCIRANGTEGTPYPLSVGSGYSESLTQADYMYVNLVSRSEAQLAPPHR